GLGEREEERPEVARNEVASVDLTEIIKTTKNVLAAGLRVIESDDELLRGGRPAAEPHSGWDEIQFLPSGEVRCYPGRAPRRLAFQYSVEIRAGAEHVQYERSGTGDVVRASRVSRGDRLRTARRCVVRHRAAVPVADGRGEGAARWREAAAARRREVDRANRWQRRRSRRVRDGRGARCTRALAQRAW